MWTAHTQAIMRQIERAGSDTVDEFDPSALRNHSLLRHLSALLPRPIDKSTASAMYWPPAGHTGDREWTSLDTSLDEECTEGRFYACYWYYLALAYGVIALVAATQLIRIQQRVPDYGWTTQKVFHLLNFLFCVLRCVSFALYTLLEKLNEKNVHQAVAKLIVFDLPGLLFFTTFTLLVLFWAEIYHQASNVDTRFLRPYFIKVNVLVYVIE
eukprot:evm.model.scf_2110.1 EVM.evm.TU.scf_2110.1   scf_2110:6894-9178(-)